jgi:hypothetical protein
MSALDQAHPSSHPAREYRSHAAPDIQFLAIPVKNHSADIPSPVKSQIEDLA